MSKPTSTPAGLLSDMPTAHQHRVIIICPQDKQISFNSWIKKNLNPEGDDWFGGLGLSLDGNEPATHYWCSAALTNDELKSLIEYLCEVSLIKELRKSKPLIRKENKDWVLNQKNSIRAKSGIRILPMDNDGEWSNPQDELKEAGLQIIQPAP